MSKTLCVYCASSDRLDPRFAQAADELGRRMPSRGWDLVYGGGKVGLMGAVAKGVKASGGRVVGVIPQFMKARELDYEGADEMLTVTTMRERKREMENRAAAFVALPGGWGTLEEIMEILTLRQLDVVRKPCVLFNQNGFYDDLLRFFEKMVAERFNKPSNLSLFSVATTVDEILSQLEQGAVPAETKWFETR